MGLICVASAKGAPGVTTTAMGLGAVWPRNVVVAECDTSGADIPLRLETADGGVIDGDRGVLSLGAAARRGLHAGEVLQHAQLVSGGLPVIAGPRGPHQASGLTNLWSSLAPALDAIDGYDTIADCGRLTNDAGQVSLLRSAKLLLVVTGVTPSEIAHARQAITGMSQVLNSATPQGTPLGVAVVAPVKDTRQVAEAKQVLERTEVPLRGVWHLAHDPKGAGFFAGDGRGRADRTPFVRTTRTVAAEIAALTEPFFVHQQAEQPPVEVPVDDEPGGRRGKRRKKATRSEGQQ